MDLDLWKDFEWAAGFSERTSTDLSTFSVTDDDDDDTPTLFSDSFPPPRPPLGEYLKGVYTSRRRTFTDRLRRIGRRLRHPRSSKTMALSYSAAGEGTEPLMDLVT